jgi:hypothetical protein
MKETLMKLEEEFHSKVEDTTEGMEEYVPQEVPPQPVAATAPEIPPVEVPPPA